MQCKAVELLEVLLEETNKDGSPELIKAISKDLKKKQIFSFVKAVYKKVIKYYNLMYILKLFHFLSARLMKEMISRRKRSH